MSFPRFRLLEDDDADLDWQFVRTLLDYDEASGDLYWVFDWSHGKSGRVAGYVREYQAGRVRYVGLDGRKWRAHELVWYWLTGSRERVIPRDGNLLNTRWRNLRKASSHEASQLKGTR